MKFSAELAGRLELSLWHPLATATQFEALFASARNTRARAVCVPSGRVPLAIARLEDSDIKVVALVGFPLGNADSDTKRFEAEAAIDNGAQELEMVLNLARLKEGDPKAVLRELRDVVECADERPVCVSIECPWLAREEIVQASHLIVDSGATAVAASSGFWPNNGIEPATIKLLREATSAKFQVKAAPVRNEQDAEAFISAGATRLGIVADLAPTGL